MTISKAQQNFRNAVACMRCGSILHPVAVHGHTQCASCGQLIEECCQGSQPKQEEKETKTCRP